MGYEKRKRPVFVHGSAESVETLNTTGGSGSTMKDEGITFLNSDSTAGTNVFVLPTPPRAGALKRIVANVGTTDAADVVAASTASVFWGTTFNAIRFSTAAEGSGAVTLIARTSTQWTIDTLSAVNATTAAGGGGLPTLIGTTVTTG